VSQTRQRGALDPADDDWVERLSGDGPERERAAEELHALLLAAVRAEAGRRAPSLPDAVLADLPDLSLQAANDALAAVLGKLDTFRGESRFTTWAYKFAIFEISSRLRRHAWRGRRVELDEDGWDQLVAPDGASPEQRALLEIVQQAIATELTERQRLVLDAVVLQGVPVDVLAERLDTTRGAIYKTLHDARTKLRRHAKDAGYDEVLT
jgi:RNA polymerase sigma-70 factor (ECF subfamily)